MRACMDLSLSRLRVTFYYINNHSIQWHATRDMVKVLIRKCKYLLFKCFKIVAVFSLSLSLLSTLDLLFNNFFFLQFLKRSMNDLTSVAVE